MAEGFLRIAVDNMANAIKKISVERGHDVTGYTLQCFGGAGGQHACLVADALGMRRVLIHPLAGVLSAFGMGLAEIRACANASLICRSTRSTRKKAMTEIAAEATAEVKAQGVAEVHVWHRRTCATRARISRLGAAGSVAEMVAAFEDLHQQRFGFVTPERALQFEMVSVEAIGTPVKHRVARAGAPARFSRSIFRFTSGAARQVPLSTADTFCGPVSPALPSSPNPRARMSSIRDGRRGSTGWQSVLERVEKKARPTAAGTEADPGSA